MERPPVPEPLDPDGVRTVAAGTAAWGLAALVLLPFAGRLDEHLDVLWVCLTGFGLGLVGLGYCVRRRQILVALSAARGS